MLFGGGVGGHYYKWVGVRLERRGGEVGIVH